MMVQGILLVLSVGFIAGEIAGRMGLPKLIGMLLAGILVGPDMINIMPPQMLELSAQIRTLALLVVLTKAGLGLDREKILQEGSVAIRLGFLPAVIEAAVVAVATRYIMGWDWYTSWLLGWVICAASPAVIVPMMLRLKAKGWGVDKGIPDLILAGGTASDATAVTMFGIFLAWLVEGVDLSAAGSGLAIRLLDIPIQIGLGLLMGYLAGRMVVFLLSRRHLAESIVHDLIVLLSVGLGLIIADTYIPYSSFLAVMVMGFVVLESDPVLARRLRNEVGKVWIIGEIFLFVLIGSVVNISVIGEAGGRGVVIVLVGLLVGRWAGIFASTVFSRITIKERFFMVVGDMAKATVQAAIGGIPLAMGVDGGEYILAIAVLSILITAPLGAFGTACLAPRMLVKGDPDPTKVTVHEKHRFLVAYDGSPASSAALIRAARTARQLDADLVLLHVRFDESPPLTRDQLVEALGAARDIASEIVIARGNPADVIIETAESRGVDYIYMGKRTIRTSERLLLGDVTQHVTGIAGIPVILVE
ncbi:sodium/proton antiporter, CPA1 family [Alkalispirochaeta americana]|uniref:Sodium/proton antiporter, CPA1 family n=1 Tax=Alkalispirochaeta americana TaxID=159291 RepID=A0A1N6VS30_9SPIO|nr:cation:proton antiporter [Alkalispirochaeta americana]SIQ80578.1 sodium/proton antiporter, CPA1 family [Alkalispirochaeta americana]